MYFSNMDSKKKMEVKHIYLLHKQNKKQQKTMDWTGNLIKVLYLVFLTTKQIVS